MSSDEGGDGGRRMPKGGDRADGRARSDLTVRVTFFADLRRFLPKGEDGPQQYRLPAGATIGDLLGAIGIAAESEVTAGRNGDLAGRDTMVADGDEIVLFSPMEGG